MAAKRKDKSKVANGKRNKFEPKYNMKRDTKEPIRFCTSKLKEN